MNSKSFGRYKVEYDGTYPSACMGRLKVWKNDELVYNKEFCCSSSGSVWFDEDWEAHVESGELSWDDVDEFSYDSVLVSLVKDVLSDVYVCCGGCV